MVVEIDNGRSTKLIGFNTLKLDPLAVQLPLYSFPA
jgi:hypothetical protein